MKKLLVMMLLCVGLCFAACGKKEEKAEQKSVFVVTINGKEYDLTGDYMTLLNEFIDDGVLVLNPTNLYPYEKDGSLGEHRNDEEFYELLKNRKYVGMSEGLLSEGLLFGDLIMNQYGVFIDVEENSVQESVQELINTEETGKYIYADGKLVDLAPYYEMVQKEKEENTTLFEITENYGWMIYGGTDGALSIYSQEHRDEMTIDGRFRPLSMRSSITVSEAIELIPNFEEELVLDFACLDMYNKAIENQIEWFGMIFGSSRSVSFRYYENDAKEAKEKAERNGWTYE